MMKFNRNLFSENENSVPFRELTAYVFLNEAAEKMQQLKTDIPPLGI